MIRWSCNIVLHKEVNEDDDKEETDYRNFDGDNEFVTMQSDIKVVDAGGVPKVKLGFNHWNELWLCRFGLKNSLSQSAIDELREWFTLVRFICFTLCYVF